MNYILQLECSTCGYSHAEWKGETACNDLFHTIGHISVSEQSQDELEPLPDQKWDGGDIGEVLKHGRE